ncbi:MAG: zinc ribbon domain-containing protein [Candidatus Sericytochromatia bacterium]|nr:zinc ribbon domain-containing protein [Candidatus Sericytochromatia bacterium]
MPSYDYSCKACSQPFEIVSGMDESRDHVACPHCASADVFRQYGRIGMLGAAQTASAAPAHSGGHAGGCCGGH